MASNPDKEAELTARMEQIKKRNAELEKRYEEVKADKLNAELSSNQFNERKKSTPIEEKRNIQERVSVKSRLGSVLTERQSQPLRHPVIHPAVYQKRAEKELGEPPPDPKFSFLADRSRENYDDAEIERPRRNDSRRHPTNYGGKDFDNVKTNMQRRRMQERNSPRDPPRNKMEMSLSMTGKERREYEAWRTERAQIESERMNRQKTSSGQWKREWDKNKNSESGEREQADVSHRNRNRDYRETWRTPREGRGMAREGGERDFREFSSYQKYKPQKDDLNLHINISSETNSRHVVLAENRKQAEEVLKGNFTRDENITRGDTKTDVITVNLKDSTDDSYESSVLSVEHEEPTQVSWNDDEEWEDASEEEEIGGDDDDEEVEEVIEKKVESQEVIEDHTAQPEADFAQSDDPIKEATMAEEPKETALKEENL